MPDRRAVAALSVGILAALALAAVVVSHAGLAATELAQTAAKTGGAALPAVPGLATHAEDPTEAKKLFSYLAAESYTPQNEKGFLASRLGLDDASRDSPAVAARQMKKGKMPVKEEKEPNYDVPYFSKFLLPPPPHYTRGGMHAATAQAEQARQAAGLVDDDGVHYMGKESGQKLAKELKDEERAYLFSENHGIVWQSAAERKKFEDEAMTAAARKKFAQEHMQNPLDRKQDKMLARALEAGIAYATLPNHGVPVEERKDAVKSKDAGVVTGAAGKKLAEELEAGEQQALAFEAAQANREEEVKRARSQVGAPRVGAVRGAKLAKEQAEEENLAHELMEGQRQALLAPFGYKENDTDKSKGAKRQKQSQGRVAPRIMAAQQHKLQQLWHVESHPKLLTLAQDRNVAKFLSQGINKVFPKPEPARAPQFLSKEAGEQLVNAAKQDEKAEERLWTPPQEKFVARKNGMRMAMEMEKSLKKENKAGGTYIDKYLHRVTGSPLRGPQRPRYVMSGSNEGERWYDEQLSTRLEKGMGWEHKQQARKYRQEHQKYLNPKQMQALRDYMQPAVRVGKGVAPGLGFAV